MISADEDDILYRWGGAVDYQSRTNIPALFVGDCNDDPARLTWTFSPDIQVDGQQSVTLTFVVHAAFDDGTYYNQANAKYDPWWDSSPVVVWTPYTAEYTAGTGTPKCGNDLDVLVTKDVVPQSAVPGVQTEFTYTVTLENTSATDRYICEIEDLLPPEYTYVLGSSGDYPSNIDTLDPDEKWVSTPERWRLEWGDGSATTTPLVTLTPGETRTQVFRATATVEPGINYYNEIQAGYALSLEPGGGCLDSGTGKGGAAGQSSVATPSLYDIQAVASDGSIRSRIVFYESSGDIDILSWQEY